MKINLNSNEKEIDEEENNKMLSNQNDNEAIKIEQMQVLNEKNKKNLSPEEQFKNYPNYKFLKCFGILICKIGNTFTCNFDINNNNSPKICIGPQWYLAIFSNVLITAIIVSMYFFFVELNSPFWQKFFYLCFGFMIYFYFNRCALINPGIVQSKNRTADSNGFCSICQVYFNPNNNVEHCDMCGICVEKMDHHCIWVGKCVGKNNKFSFYAMLVSIGFVYAYIILMAIFQYSLKIGKKYTIHK